ncbi:hypothetical protein LRAMOSA05989 [Lichtheimia ramosa]|uniref:beta-N-acetylhexosaminidase n=1 Tax=Lichtheimia ramosa TaxID=688394 RepID=A0A077X2K0_9FUNG|nr:hypothetical protein LRAMOSA05989 [Lichtheimia ramosa]
MAFGSLIDSQMAYRSNNIFLAWTTILTPIQVQYAKDALSSLDISVKNNSVALDFGVDESYTLDVPSSGGKASLSTATWVGTLRGPEAFSQLVVASTSNKKSNLVVHTAHIEDKPSFPHRGIRLVLEIDMPAHTGIIAEPHPDYIIIGYHHFWNGIAAESPVDQIDLLNNDAWQFQRCCCSKFGQLHSRITL